MTIVQPQPSQSTSADYQPKGISQGSSNGNGSSDWVPLPIGNKYIFIIDDVTVKDPVGPPRVGTDGKPQKQYQRVLFRLNLDEAQATKLKERTASKLAPGQEQSTSAWYSAGYTWGWVDRDDIFHTTKLYDFVATAGGFGVAADLKKWLMADGIVDPRWFIGMKFRGAIEHQPRKDGAGVWANVAAMSMDEYEASNREILAARLESADAERFDHLQDIAGDDEEGEPF